MNQQIDNELGGFEHEPLVTREEVKALFEGERRDIGERRMNANAPIKWRGENCRRKHDRRA